MPLVAIISLYLYNEVRINAMDQFLFPFLMSRVAAFELDISQEKSTQVLF